MVWHGRRPSRTQGFLLLVFLAAQRWYTRCEPSQLWLQQRLSNIDLPAGTTKIEMASHQFDRFID
jgi:hypothetical protein